MLRSVVLFDDFVQRVMVVFIVVEGWAKTVGDLSWFTLACDMVGCDFWDKLKCLDACYSAESCDW
jgi:hypothetical protein